MIKGSLFTGREFNPCIELSFTLANIYIYIYKIKFIYLNYIHKVISDIVVVNVFGKKELTAGF